MKGLPKGVELPSIRPMGDKLLVYLEPEQDHYSEAPSLVRPDAAKQDHVFRVGRVCKVGPGERHHKTGKRKPIGIEPGARVLFVKFVATHTQTAKSIQATLGADFALIDKDDALLELPEEMTLDQISQ